MEYDRRRLKMEAKEAMRNTRPRPIWITLLYMAILWVSSSVVNTAVNTMSGGGTLEQMLATAMLNGEDMEEVMQSILFSSYGASFMFQMALASMVGGVILTLWSGLMSTGYSGYCLSMARGENPPLEKLFAVFPRWASVVVTQLLVVVFVTLWSMLFGVGFVIVAFVAGVLLVLVPALGVLLLLCAYVAVLAAILWVSLRYAMVNYLVVDQGITGTDALNESKRLMRGNKGKLFMLNLSFINWYLPSIIGVLLIVFSITEALVSEDAYLLIGTIALSIVLFALTMLAQVIVSIWLTPYRTGAEARFYDWLTGRGTQPPRPPMPPVQQGGAQNYTYSWTDSASSSGQGTDGSDQSWSGTWSGGSDSDGADTKDDPWDR